MIERLSQSLYLTFTHPPYDFPWTLLLGMYSSHGLRATLSFLEVVGLVDAELSILGRMSFNKLTITNLDINDTVSAL